MSFFLSGVSHKNCPVDLRELYPFCSELRSIAKECV